MFRIKVIEENDKEIVRNFQCEEKQVSNFLINEAMDYQNEKLAVTQLCFYDGQLVGFFTLFNDIVCVKRKMRDSLGMNVRTLDYYPAIKLHYLGVDKRYTKKRYGEFLLLYVFKLVKELSLKSGCVFLTLEYLPKVVSFYEKYQFNILKREGTLTYMFFKLSEIE